MQLEQTYWTPIAYAVRGQFQRQRPRIHADWLLRRTRYAPIRVVTLKEKNAQTAA